MVKHLAQAVPGLDAGSAEQALLTAGAWQRRALKELHAHLQQHASALTDGSPNPPLALVRLAHLLMSAGHEGIVLPACSRCGRVTPELQADCDGRLCGRCKRPSRIRICARCGEPGEIHYRRPEGGICARCYQADPERARPCGKCGKLRPPAGRGDDGTPICHSCWPRPERICVQCGRLAPTKRLLAEGPICFECYRQHHQPQRRCGLCGQQGRIARRASESSPDICLRCYRRPTVLVACDACGRERACVRLRTGQLACRACEPKPRHQCVRCGRSRIAAAQWPMGPVCGPCYLAVRQNPAGCSRCGGRRPLIGRDEDANPICGRCAGVPDEVRCRTCHDPERSLFIAGECDRCVLTGRLTELLAGANGVVATELLPLCDSLVRTEHPWQLLDWLQGRGARLLATLAISGKPITHQTLDELPQGHNERYVRTLLVNAGVLPRRHEDLERIVPWLEQVLSVHPARHGHLVRQFTHWVLLRRARRRADHARQPAASTGYLRSQVYVALELLAWLDDKGIALARLNQGQTELWLTTGGSRRYLVRLFLKWTAERGLSERLEVPRAPTSGLAGGRHISEDERWSQLRTCLGDGELPLEFRAAGALILLFGLREPDVRRLTADHLQQNGREIFLQLPSRKPLLLPPRVAKLVLELAASPRRRTVAAVETAPPWLFPGLIPGDPMSDVGFNHLLRRHGFRSSRARPAALISLASQLPVPVLAELLGLSITTARKWAAQTQPDWADYLAARVAGGPAKEEYRT